jgi:hypothetical protein
LVEYCVWVREGKKIDSNSESLKTLRLMHQLLMIAALGVLVLGSTPDPTRDLNAALDELIALRAIRQPTDQEYGSYLRRYVQPLETDKALILDMARQTGANVPADIVIFQPFASDFGSIGSRLMDFDVFFGGTHKIARLELVHRDDIAASRIEFLRRQLAIQNESHVGVTLTGVEFGGPISHLRDGTPIADWRNLSEGSPITGDLAFKFADVLNAAATHGLNLDSCGLFLGKNPGGTLRPGLAAVFAYRKAAGGPDV